MLLLPMSLPLTAQTGPLTAELIPRVGIIDNTFAVGAGFLFNVTNCLGVEASMDAIVNADGYSALVSCGNITYGLWYCCIPSYYVKFVYFTGGIGNFSRIGKGDRSTDLALNMGVGARLSINEKLGIGGEMKDNIVFGSNKKKHLWAYRLGLHFTL